MQRLLRKAVTVYSSFPGGGLSTVGLGTIRGGVDAGGLLMFVARVGLVTGDDAGEGEGDGVGLRRGDGLGAGVLKLAFKFILKLKLPLLKFAFVLKLKFESKPRFVFRFTFWFNMLALTLVKIFAGWSFCSSQNNPAPKPKTTRVPNIVNTIVFIVFGCSGGG